MNKVAVIFVGVFFPSVVPSAINKQHVMLLLVCPLLISTRSSLLTLAGLHWLSQHPPQAVYLKSLRAPYSKTPKAQPFFSWMFFWKWCRPNGHAGYWLETEQLTLRLQSCQEVIDLVRLEASWHWNQSDGVPCLLFSFLFVCFCFAMCSSHDQPFETSASWSLACCLLLFVKSCHVTKYEPQQTHAARSLPLAKATPPPPLYLSHKLMSSTIYVISMTAITFKHLDGLKV